MPPKEKQPELIACFTETGFTVSAEAADSSGTYYDEHLLMAFRTSPYEALYRFGFSLCSGNLSPSLTFLHRLANEFVQSAAKNPDVEITRQAAALSDEEALALLRAVPFALGYEHVSAGWIRTVWSRLAEVFAATLVAYSGTVAAYFLEQNTGLQVVGRVFFHLVENKDEDYPFAFLATYSTHGKEVGKAAHLPLKHALLEFKEENDTLLALLAAVARAADQSLFISELVESGELFSPLKFTPDEAYDFLKEIELCEKCGIVCRIPDWWKRKTTLPRLKISVGQKAPSQVGMDALLSFNPELALGDESITKEEIQALLAQTSGLSLLKGRWVEVDHEKLRATLAAFEKAEALAETGALTLAEAMRMQLQLPGALNPDSADVEVQVTSGEWLDTIRHRLLSPAELSPLEMGQDFHACLRPYQQQGVDWLGLMHSLGFGALLADDMGLGKTVQILGLLEHMRQRHDSMKVLLILPASLLGNWQKELERFTPKLRYTVLHGADKNAFDPQNLPDVHVIMTTYGMAMRTQALGQMRWDLLILDEAQAIKNPSAKQTKAIKQIPAAGRIAMTGTPVENRLSDLWSLFDFIDPGLLGSAKEFTSFAKKLGENDDYTKLRAVISPFILRRLKTDKQIISDLPDKLEARSYATLSKKQAVLYNSLVKELKSTLEIVQEGVQRKGIVLASIMKCKQICNHPDQYLGQDVFDSRHSGKFALLGEICETIRDKRERVLIFTQFREMTEPLAVYLETVFGRPGLVLHGGTSVTKRSEMVEQFQGDEYVPFMVLSLKAGGVGLNLTAANHVIHFDRWWNPAVENQATDRAFRIGQRKNVMVHKFITQGTIEERIDKMIADKEALAGQLTPTAGEKWITELNNDELMSLFTLI